MFIVNYISRKLWENDRCRNCKPLSSSRFSLCSSQQQEHRGFRGQWLLSQKLHFPAPFAVRCDDQSKFRTVGCESSHLCNFWVVPFNRSFQLAMIAIIISTYGTLRKKKKNFIFPDLQAYCINTLLSCHLSHSDVRAFFIFCGTN